MLDQIKMHLCLKYRKQHEKLFKLKIFGNYIWNILNIYLRIVFFVKIKIYSIHDWNYKIDRPNLKRLMAWKNDMKMRQVFWCVSKIILYYQVNIRKRIA